MRREGDAQTTMADLIEREEAEEKRNLENELLAMKTGAKKTATKSKSKLSKFFVNGEEGMVYVDLVGVKLRILIGE